MTHTLARALKALFIFKKKIGTGGLLLPIILLLSGCTASIHDAADEKPVHSIRRVQMILIVPVQMDDGPIDLFDKEELAKEIRWQAAQTLRSKGYIVKEAGEKVGSRSLVSALGEQEALVRIRVTDVFEAFHDNHDDHDGRIEDDFEVYAEVSMVAGPQQKLIWQAKGGGRSRGFYNEYTLAAIDLAEKLFAPLPVKTKP